MAMTRIDANNFGQVEGRIVRDPNYSKHSDGSQSVMFTLAVDRDYKDREGNTVTDYVDVQGFISKNAKSNGVYDYVKQGNVVRVFYTVQSYQKNLPVKQFVAELKKLGVKTREEANAVKNAIIGLGLAKFDKEHGLTDYRKNLSITGVNLIRSSKKNFEEHQEKRAEAEKRTDETQNKPAGDVQSDKTEEISDEDLPF